MRNKNESQKAEKFWCLSRDFRGRNDFELYEIEATDEDAAWEEVEDNIQTNMTQDWLITVEEAQAIKRLLADF